MMSRTPKTITELVQKFQRNIHEYRNPKYNETLIRVEFVNSFWKALGWDMESDCDWHLLSFVRFWCNKDKSLTTEFPFC